MEFKDWIEAKFIQWSRGRKSETQFALYLGISQATFNAWKNGTRGAPKSIKIIRSLAEKLGPETYDALGMPRPEQSIDLHDQLVSFGLTDDLAEDFLEMLDDARREVMIKGIVIDSPEGKRMVSKSFVRLISKLSIKSSNDGP